MNQELTYIVFFRENCKNRKGIKLVYRFFFMLSLFWLQRYFVFKTIIILLSLNCATFNHLSQQYQFKLFFFWNIKLLKQFCDKIISSSCPLFCTLFCPLFCSLFCPCIFIINLIYCLWKCCDDWLNTAELLWPHRIIVV